MSDPQEVRAKMCIEHWNQIRAEVEKQGLTKFVAKSTEDLQRKLESGERDPLMGAHNAIMGAVIEKGGLAWVAVNPCPYCFVIGQRAANGITEPLDWIEGAVEDELNYFKEKGLITAQ